MSDLEARLTEALAQAAHGLFATAPAKAKTWDQLSDDIRTKYRQQFAAPLVAGILPIVQNELDCKSVVHDCCVQVEDVRKMSSKLMDNLHETSNGLGDWHDATEYIDWANKEVRDIWLAAGGGKQ